MSRILLTGASGFMGRYVLKALLDQRHTVLAPTRRPVSLQKNIEAPHLKILPGSFDDPALETAYAEFRPEFIIHLAALRGDGNGSWKDYYHTNVLGTDRLVEFALNAEVTGFIYCSTTGIYGIPPSRLPADPWTYADPVGHYRRSEHIAEKTIVAKLRSRVPFLIMRPTLPYGPGDRGFVYKLIHRVKAHQFPLVRKEVKIHLLDVATIPEIIIRAISAPMPDECIVNVADQKPIKLHELVNLIHTHFYGKPYPTILKTPQLLYAAGWQFGKLLKAQWLQINLQLFSHSWYFDTSNLENTFGISLKNTLDTFQLYLDYSFSKPGQP